MNARKRATGVEYTRKFIGDDVSVDEALAIITINVGMGIDVPIVVGPKKDDYAHYVVVVRKDGNRFQIHDVWAGQTVWRTATDFRRASSACRATTRRSRPWPSRGSSARA